MSLLDWMLLTVLLVAVSVGAWKGSLGRRRWHRFWWGTFWPWFVAALVIGTAVSSFISMIVFFNTDRVVWEPDSRVTLGALSNGSETEGRFFLGSGVVGEDAVYTYLEVLPDGGQRMQQLDADRDITLYTSDNPRIEVGHYRSPYFNFDGVAVYKIYLPAGSIWQGYNVDVRK